VKDWQKRELEYIEQLVELIRNHGIDWMGSPGDSPLSRRIIFLFSGLLASIIMKPNMMSHNST
jgi:hypothetical protein